MLKKPELNSRSIRERLVCMPYVSFQFVRFYVFELMLQRGTRHSKLGIPPD